MKEIAEVDDLLQDDESDKENKIAEEKVTVEENETIEKKENVEEKESVVEKLTLEERLRIEERIRLLEECLRLHELEKEKNKTPKCRHCGEVFAADHQCSVERTHAESMNIEQPIAHVNSCRLGLALLRAILQISPFLLTWRCEYCIPV